MFTIGTAFADECHQSGELCNMGTSFNQGGEEIARYQRSIFNTFVAVLLNIT